MQEQRKQKFTDLQGRRYGSWSVGPRVEDGAGRRARYACVCVCGTKRSVSACHLVRGATQSCGCQIADWGARTRTHGKTKTSEYRIWSLMKGRCSNPSNPGYFNYGGRGVQVCDRWAASFEAFLADMGPRPSPAHSVDRWPNQNGNYEPGNCRWATPVEQGRNTRRNRMVEVRGERMCLSEAVERYGGNYGTVKWRIYHGKTAQEALGL